MPWLRRVVLLHRGKDTERTRIPEGTAKIVSDFYASTTEGTQLCIHLRRYEV